MDQIPFQIFFMICSTVNIYFFMFSETPDNGMVHPDEGPSFLERLLDKVNLNIKS